VDEKGKLRIFGAFLCNADFAVLSPHCLLTPLVLRMSYFTNKAITVNEKREKHLFMYS